MTDVGICIPAEKFRQIIQALSEISVGTVFEFHRTLGLKAAVIHPKHHFKRDFQLAPSYFEWTENWDKIPADQPIRLPVDFGVLLQFFTSLPSKDFHLNFFPVPRLLQALQFKEKIPTEPYTFSEQKDIVELPKNVNTIFPAVNSETYPILVQLSRALFVDQVLQNLSNQFYVQIAIIGSRIVFYCEGDAFVSFSLPVTVLSHGNMTLKNGAFLQSFNEVEPDKAALQNVRSVMEASDTSVGCAYIEEKEHGRAGLGRGLVQVHSLRFLTFACKAKLDASQVILGMSPHFGMVLLFPLTGSLDKDRVLLNENHYFRYSLLPITDVPLQSFPFGKVRW